MSQDALAVAPAQCPGWTWHKMTKQGDVIEVILETARQADVTIDGSGPFSPTWSKMNFPLSHFSCCVSLTAPAIAACGRGVAAIGIRILPSKTDP